MFKLEKLFTAGAAVLLAAAALAPLAAYAAPGPGRPAQASSTGLTEARWLPWLGCWELVADAVDNREVESTGRRVVCVAPRPDGIGVALTTHIDGIVVSENTVVADNQDRALQEEGCAGTQSATWSADNRRLLSKAAASCEGGSTRAVSGLSMLVEPGRWLELQSVSLDDGEHRELVVRHYRRIDDESMQELGFAPLGANVAAQAASARAAASGPLDLEDVLELAAVAPSELVEAAIVESDATFDLDRDALFRLADAGVDEHLIDLMVAVSFPEQFVVDTGSKEVERTVAIYPMSYRYRPYYGSCYGLYYRSVYGPYSSAYCDPWFTPWGFGYYGSYPYYGRSGYGISVKVPPSGSLYGGRVIKGRGYATVRGRNQSRNDGSRRVFGKLFGTSSSSRIGSRSSSGSGKASSVSPMGFSSGSSSSGGSSSSSSSGAVHAKPRGGGH